MIDHTHDWINTFSGGQINLFDPKMEDILIEDVAHALSNICRFTGHCLKFYSVAQHCVLVSKYCDPQFSKHGLLHDLSEYALADISSPLKRMLEMHEYKKIEKNFQTVAYQKFGLEINEPENVKMTDLRMLATEARDLMKLNSNWKLSFEPFEEKIIPLPPEEAKLLFINRFDELFVSASGITL